MSDDPIKNEREKKTDMTKDQILTIEMMEHSAMVELMTELAQGHLNGENRKYAEALRMRNKDAADLYDLLTEGGTERLVLDGDEKGSFLKELVAGYNAFLKELSG